MHTPTPWHSPGLLEIHDEQHRVIADCVGDEEVSPDECAANADFIVRAVNSHAELLTALEAAADDLECAIDTFKVGGLQFHNEAGTLKRVRAAIAKAKGEA
jgi:hypothetical protein